MIKSIIFDFDGTLVNSQSLIYHCFKEITLRLAPSRVNYANNVLIGPPLNETAKEILGKDNVHLLDDFIASFIKLHDQKIIFDTTAYPNAKKVLENLYNKNIHMAIATNKRHKPTIKLINYLGWKIFFKKISCTDSEINKNKSKKMIIEEIIQKNPEFRGAIIVGDTVNDALAAKENNLSFIKANYGYGKKQDWSSVEIYKDINNLNDLLKIYKE